MTSKVLKILIFSAIVATMGCAAQKQELAGQPKHVATTLEVARAAYLSGLNSLKEGDFDGAFQSFSTASRAPSHVVYSKLARLRLADTLYYQNMFDESAKAYVAFINSNTSNPNLHYAYFRLADSKVQSISGDFFLVPPSDRRDQKQVRSALKSIQSFIANFPDSPYCGQVLAMRNRMVDTVTSFEMEVARFYMTRKKPQGAIGRIELLMKDVPAARDSDKVRYAYIAALAAAGSNEAAFRECTDYLERFPSGRNRDEVRTIGESAAAAMKKAAEDAEAAADKAATEVEPAVDSEPAANSEPPADTESPADEPPEDAL